MTGREEGAIHSSSSRGCVAESRFRGKSIRGGWNKVGLWNLVEYDYGNGSVLEGTSDYPIPEPVNEKESEYAAVWAGQGSTVNTRQGPGTSYALSKAGRIPVGTMVEILKRQNGWCRIRYTDPKKAVWYCWMKEEFLRSAEGQESDPKQVKGGTAYTVTILHLPEEDVAMLRSFYPDCTVEEECI